MIVNSRGKSNKHKLYKLYKYVINISKSKITACNYKYYPETDKIRETCFPAEIDKKHNILKIKHYVFKGETTNFTIETFKEFITALPEWDLTENFQVKGLIKDNYSEILKCTCCPFLEIEQNNGKLSICI